MIKVNNESLSKYTTVKIGGNAKELLIPESVEELKMIINELHPDYYIGGGSNLLISERDFDLVVNLRNFNESVEMLDNGLFRIGASVRLQKVINFINEKGYGGIEYLYSVPGLVGGAVVMNAGRGRKYNQTISDYIVSVEVLKNGEKRQLTKEECNFSYRNSIFKNQTEMIITSVLFKFPEMNKDESDRLKRERIELCKSKQDASKPNFGSVFLESNNRIMNFVKKHKIGKGNVHFSHKTANWIISDSGTFNDAIATIKEVEFLHKILLKKCEKEVIIWE